MITNTTGQVNVIDKLMRNFSMENPIAPVNESLEAIKKLKVEELKKILHIRSRVLSSLKHSSVRNYDFSSFFPLSHN